MVIDDCKSLGIQRLGLSAINEPKLIELYKHLGFIEVIDAKQMFSKDKLHTFEMILNK
jgi:hypothetical protein